MYLPSSQTSCTIRTNTVCLRALTVWRANMSRALRCTNPLNAPESLSALFVKACADRLADVLEDTINLCVVSAQCSVHSCCAYETQDILPEGLPPCSTYACHHEMPRAAGQNPQRLTPPELSGRLAVCTEQKHQLWIHIFARSHVDMKSIHVRVLLLQALHSVWVSSASGSMCNWILDLLTGRPLVVKIGTSSTNSRHSSPCQYSVITHNCGAAQPPHFHQLENNTKDISIVTHWVCMIRQRKSYYVWFQQNFI